MASLLSPRRTDTDIALYATVARSERSAEVDDEPDPPRVSWLLAAVGGALATAVAGWILLSGLTVIGWLAADPGSVGDAMGVGTQLWLLANGAGAELGSSAVTLVPWGATLVFAFMMSRFAGVAARQARGRPGLCVVGVTAVMTCVYAAAVVGAALLVGGGRPTLPGLVSVPTAVALSAGWGSCRALGYHPTAGWPAWCRGIPRAIVGAQLTMVAAGAGVLTAAVVTHSDRVLALTAGLHTGWVGGIVLCLAQLAFVPNAVIWTGSYTLGAGFSLGPGSVVAPASTQLGIIPSIPLLGALPDPGPGSITGLWWLAAGVLAGGVAGWLVIRARPAARFDETGLVGGLSGLLAGLVFVGLAAASGGDLGTVRLAGLGPRLLQLMWLSATTLGLAGMLVGLLLGLLRRPLRLRQAAAAAAGAADDDLEATVEVSRLKLSAATDTATTG